MNIDEILSMPVSLREEAKKYTKQHVSIIPVGKNKIPLIPWKEFCSRIATDEEIDSWFDRFPDAQIGAVTGEISRMTVVDVEAAGGEKMWNLLPQTGPISQTGGMGRHYFFEYEPNVKNAVRILDNVDIRGQNGFVVMPPSASDKGPYTWIQRAPLGPFPRKLFNLPEPNITKLKANTETKVDVSELADVFLKTKVLQFEGSSEGGRNDLITRFIGFILSEVHPSKWDKEAWPAIWAANQKNTPPLSDYELNASYQSVKQSEIANNPNRWKTEDPLAGRNPEDDDIVLMSEASDQNKNRLLTFYPLGIEIFDKEIRGGCHAGDLISIAANPGEGKSSWCMNLTKNFIKQGHKVLFFSYEMNEGMVWEKFEMMGMQKTDAIYMPRRITTGNITWVANEIKKAKKEIGIKFAVIDHLSFLTGKLDQSSKLSENYSVALTNIVRDLKDLAREEDLIIILPVHVRKQGLQYKKNEELDMNAIAHTAGVAQLSDLVFIMQRERKKDPAADDVYTGHTSISMVKNRWGHKNPKGYFEMLQEQFIYDKDYKGEGKEKKNLVASSAWMIDGLKNDLKESNDDILKDSNSDMYKTYARPN